MAVRCVAALSAPPLHVTSSAVMDISRTEKAATSASVKVSDLSECQKLIMCFLGVFRYY